MRGNMYNILYMLHVSITYLCYIKFLNKWTWKILSVKCFLHMISLVLYIHDHIRVGNWDWACTMCWYIFYAILPKTPAGRGYIIDEKTEAKSFTKVMNYQPTVIERAGKPKFCTRQYLSISALTIRQYYFLYKVNVVLILQMKKRDEKEG